MNKVELLAPAGDLEKLKVSLSYGADAVYIGGKKFSLRARSSNFDVGDIKEAVNQANKYGAKIYVTCNIIAHNEDLGDLEELKEYLRSLEKIGVTGIIVADLAIALVAKEVASNLEIHISTQLSTLNSEAINFLESIGVKRVVLGRECSLEQIRLIKQRTNIELETFIHGGMCMSVSGRCVLSNYMTDRDANRGGCAQSCRWFYNVYDSNKNLVSNEDFTFSSKDLQATELLSEMIDAGVSSLKIEGRMKSEHYLGTIVGSYRHLLDDIYTGNNNNAQIYLKEMSKAENRPTSTGFLKGKVGPDQQIFDHESDIPTQEFVAKVLEYDKDKSLAYIEQRNHFTLDQDLEVFGPHKKAHLLKIEKMWNEKGEEVRIANHAKEVLIIKCDEVLEPFDMIRRVK